MSRSFLQAMAEHARRLPDAVAVEEVDGLAITCRLTRGELWRAACGVAVAVRMKTPQGGVVLVSGANQAALPAAMIGVWLAGRIVLALSPELTEPELMAAATQAEVAGAIVQDAMAPRIASMVGTTMSLSAILGMAGADHCNAPCVGVMLQSSGTTGIPRIVHRKAAALDAVADNCINALGLGSEDRMLVTLPLHHSFGFEHGVLSCLAAGATLELHRRFEPHAVGTALVHRRVTHLPGVPFTFDQLYQHIWAPPMALRHAYSAGSALPPSVFDAATAALGVPLGQIYGATEFGSVTFNDPYASDFDPVSVGRAMPGVRLRLDEKDESGQGHLHVAASSMLSGYVGGGEHLIGGHVPTGDLARIDATGRLYITGRIKLIIDVGGVKVNPLEVEAVLVQHPAVHEAIVVPQVITPTVTRLRAVVTLRPDASVTSDELRAFARGRLARYKVPRYFEVRSALPRTATGKVLRHALACT